MRNIHKRIAALESRGGAERPVRWHRVIVDGQSNADALAAHEAQHGTISQDGVIYRVIVSPLHVNGGSIMQ